VRRPAGRELALAVGRRPDGQGPVRGGSVGPNPTDRAKNGTKKSVLVEAGGGPLGVMIAGANVPDSKLLAHTIEAIVVDRPDVVKGRPQHLCLDKGYDNPAGRAAAEDHAYTPHIRRIGEEKKPSDRGRGHKPRRWVVERTLAWLSKCRALLVRYDHHDDNYLGLIELACALLWFRRLNHLKPLDLNSPPC
jgi:putative transposase